MAEPSFPLTALSEAQRAQALERFTIIRPALEKEVSQAQLERTYHLPLGSKRPGLNNCAISMTGVILDGP
jgi:hypothetical protein